MLRLGARLAAARRSTRAAAAAATARAGRRPAVLPAAPPPRVTARRELSQQIEPAQEGGGEEEPSWKRAGRVAARALDVAGSAFVAVEMAALLGICGVLVYWSMGRDEGKEKDGGGGEPRPPPPTAAELAARVEELRGAGAGDAELALALVELAEKAQGDGDAATTVRASREAAGLGAGRTAGRAYAALYTALDGEGRHAEAAAAATLAADAFDACRAAAVRGDAAWRDADTQLYLALIQLWSSELQAGRRRATSRAVRRMADRLCEEGDESALTLEWLEGMAVSGVGVMLIYGDAAAAAEVSRRLLDGLGERPRELKRADVLAAAGVSRQLLGYPAEAAALAREVLALNCDGFLKRPSVLAGLAVALDAAGGAVEAEARLAEARETLGPDAEADLCRDVDLAAGTVARRQGRAREAAEAFERAVRGSSGGPAVLDGDGGAEGLEIGAVPVGPALPDAAFAALARHAAASGEARRAVGLCARRIRHVVDAEGGVPPELLATLSAALLAAGDAGRAAEAAGAAVRHLEAAYEGGLALPVASALVDLGRALAARGSPEEARARLNEALRTYRLLGAGPALEAQASAREALAALPRQSWGAWLGSWWR